MRSDTAPVRAGEELDVAALADFLRGKIDGAENGITLTQFPDGHSNLTYCLRAGTREYVLRRAPLGPLPPKAHDMAREYKVLRAVHPLFPPAPQVYLVCEDPTVIGAVFFVMERRHGFVLRDVVPPELAAERDHAPRLSEAFVDCLVRLHSIDVRQRGLSDLGRPEGFLDRQVRGWAERWERAKTEALPQMDRVIAWLTDHIPASGTPTLVHNDYKLDNVLWDSSDSYRIEAVLDWEMTTVGDPLADLGLTLCYWSHTAAPELRTVGIPAITSGPGWYTRDEFVRRYAEKTGRDVLGIAYHEVLGVFKLAVIVQQIYYRFYRGQTTDERFRHFDQPVKRMVITAAALVEKAS
jgi:aminoglycoside phosphotransferase (APT) family kinase protein